MGDEEEYLESVRKDNQQAPRLKRKKKKGKNVLRIKVSCCSGPDVFLVV